MNDCAPLLFEQLATRLTRWVKANRAPLISALICGTAAHFYAFTNKLISFDELDHLFDKGFTTSSGRWGLDLISYIFPDVSMPWLYGLISLLIFAVAACLIVEIFQIRSKLFRTLLTGNIIVFPSLTATVVFMFTLAPYAVAFLLAVIAVILLKRETMTGFLCAMVCMIFSLSIYQAYISLAASLLVLLLIQQLLKGEDIAAVIRRGVCALVFLILSLGTYYLITMVVNQVVDVQFNQYAQDRVSFRISYIPTAVVEGYKAFLRFFTQGMCSLAPTPTSRWIHTLCCILTLGLLGLWMIREKKDAVRIGLLLVLLFLLPLAINAMYFFVIAWEQAIHCVVLYSYITVYLFSAVVVDVCWDPCETSKIKGMAEKIAVNAISIGLVAIILINVYVANATYLKLYLKYENTSSFYASLMADLRTYPEFTRETPVAICGEYPEPHFYWDNFSFTDTMFGATGVQPGGFVYNYLHFYVGIRHSDIPQIIVDEQSLADIMETEEYAQMACYPYYGCIRMIGDTLVVKLS